MCPARDDIYDHENYTPYRQAGSGKHVGSNKEGKQEAAR
jgi:hypothetical protein